MVVAECVMTGNYFTNYNRWGANSWFANLYTNNTYLNVKNNFLREFQVLNRNFTEDERIQFLHNKDLKEKGKKKYVFNPFLHSSEDAYKEEYLRINSGRFILSEKSKLEIATINAKKIELGEEVVMKPFNTASLSNANTQTGLVMNQLFTHRNVI